MDPSALQGGPPALAPSLSGVDEEPRRALERLASRAFRHVQLCVTQPCMRPRDLDASARRDVRAQLRRLELDVAGLDFFIPTEHYFDAARVDRAVGATHEAIRLAADLGRCPVSLVLPQPTGDDPAGEETITEVLRAIRESAHQHDVNLADHAVPMAHRAADDLVGIGIDPAAWLGAGRDPASVVREHGGPIVAARFCDLNLAGLRTPPGERGGRLDVLAYGIALATAGDPRPLILDARQWLDPWRGFEHAARIWRDEMRVRE